MTYIGKPQREYTVEPAVDPVKVPEPVPAKEREKEKVPA